MEGRMRSYGFTGWSAAAVLAGGLIGWATNPAVGQILIVGNDEKPGWDEGGKPITREPGHDTVSVIDISKPDMPQVISTISLTNSIAGPPTNLAVSPSGEIALVANSMEPITQGWAHRLDPDNKVFLVDLKADPPKITGTIAVGKQPSGMAISPKGDLALVTNRADGTISVLSIRGKDVLVVDTVTVGTGTDSASAVAITPDGKRALAAKAAANKVALLSINGGKVTYDKRDLPGGIFPYNIAVTPDGKLALTADTGNGGSSDGSVDTASVIDLEANPPRVIDHVTVGDSPEGLVISPKGDLAVSIEARGSNMPKSSFFYHPAGAVTALKIDGKKVTNAGEIYVGNYMDQDLWVLQVDGSKLTDTVQRIKLPGHPASLRAGPQ